MRGVIRAQIHLADAIAAQLEARNRRQTSKRWRDWVRKSLREGGRKVYQWVRQPETWPQGTTVESPLAQLGRIEKEWRGIWSKGRPCVSSSNVEVPAPAAASTLTVEARVFFER